jgi:hypothetical protein
MFLVTKNHAAAKPKHRLHGLVKSLRVLSETFNKKKLIPPEQYKRKRIMIMLRERA